MARFRAVVMIHPAGLGGSPVDGHRCTAMVNASWTASSASSMSPKARTRTATARPYSSRNTRSMSAASTAGTRSVLRNVLERAYLDGSVTGPGRPGGPLERRVQVASCDHPEPADMLLAFGKRTVGDQDLAALMDPHDGGGVRGVKSPAEHPCTAGPKLAVEGVDVPVHLLSGLGRGLRAALDRVNGEHVLLHQVLLRPPGR